MTNSEEIKSIIESPFINLINTTRYSGFSLIKSESVSDHVYGMIALALEIIPRINEVIDNDNKVNIGTYYDLIDIKEIIYRVAIHDLDESLSCDIPRPFKYYTKEFKNKIDEVTTSMLNDKFDNNFVKEIINAKDDTVEGRLVSLFDTMQAGIKMRHEIKLGNQFIKTEIPNIIDILDNFDTSIFNSRYSVNVTEYINILIYYYIVELNSLL